MEPTVTLPGARGLRLRTLGRARSAWPLDPAVVHLNHGSFGAVPTDVVRLQEELRSEADRNPVAWFPRLPGRVAHARHDLAGFLGARPEDLAFVPNASAAATVVYNSVRLERGDEILVTDHGYGAVTMGARRLARRFGASVRTVAIPLCADDEDVLARFEAALTDRVRLLVVDQVTSPTARRLPVAGIVARAHRAGARVLVDGAHAPGLIDHPARCGEPDWWFGNLHKWPCAPRGSAVLVSRAPDRDELWPLIDSWAADQPFPARFDTQGTIDATSYLAAPRAIEWVEREYGWAQARTSMNELADQGAGIIGEALAPHLHQEPVVDLPSPVPSMRLVRIPAGIAATRERADALRDVMFETAGVEAAFTVFDARPYLRLSVHLYTEEDDFHRFVERCVPVLLELADRHSGPAEDQADHRRPTPLEGED